VIEEHTGAVSVELREDDEARAIAECHVWVAEQGLAEGVVDYELVDEASSEALAILDLAWPEGMQLELTEPVALLLGEPPEVERVAAAHGFRFFTSPKALKEYVEREVLEREAGTGEIPLAGVAG
jgi:hypothetical protein